MYTQFIISTLLVLSVLSSCIVGTKVAIHNKSGTDKNIQAHYPAGTRPAFHTSGGHNPSLRGYDHTLTEGAITSRDWYRYPVIIPVASLDTVARTYWFTLKAGHQVILAEGYPSFVPQFGQWFLIDGKDTIVLDRKGTFFKKRPKLGKGGNWTYSITAHEP